MASSDQRVSMDAAGKYNGGELPPESPFTPLQSDNAALPTKQPNLFEPASADFQFQPSDAAAPTYRAAPLFQSPPPHPIFQSPPPHPILKSAPPPPPTPDPASTEKEKALRRLNTALMETVGDKVREAKYNSSLHEGEIHRSYRLQNELDAVKKERDEAILKVEDVTKQRDAHEHNLNLVGRKLHEANNLQHITREDFEEAEAQVSRVEAKFEVKLYDANSELKRLVKVVEELEASNEFYEAEDMAHDKEKEVWDAKDKGQKDTIEQRDEHISELIFKNIQLEKSKDREIEQIRADNEALKQHGRDCIAERDSTIETQHQEIARITAAHESFETQGKAFVERHDKMIEADKQEIANLTAAHKDVSDRLESMKKDGKEAFDKEKRMIEAQKAEIAQLKGNDQNAPDSYNALKDAEETVTERNRTIEAQNMQIVRLTDANKNGEGLNNALQREAQEAIQKCNTTIEAQSQEIAQLKADYQDASDRYKALKDAEGTIREPNQTIEAQNVQIAQLTDANTNAEQLNNNLKKETKEAIQKCNTTIEEQSQEIAQLKADFQNASDQCKALKGVEGTIREPNEAQNIQIAQLTDANTNAEHLNNSLKKEMKEAIQKCNATTEAQSQEIAQLKVDNETAAGKYSALLKEGQKLLRAHNKTNRELGTTIEAQKQEIIKRTPKEKNVPGQDAASREWKEETLREHNKAIREQEETIEAQQQKLSKVRGALAECETQEKAHKDRIATLKADLEKVSDRYAESEIVIENGECEIERLKKRVKDNREEFEAREDELLKEDGVKKARYGNISFSMLEAMHKKLPIMETALAEAHAREQAKADALAALQAEHAKLSDEHASSKTEADGTIREREKKMEIQKQELSEMGAAIEELREKEALQSKEIADLKREMQEAKGKGKASTSTEKQLEKAMEEHAATIGKHERTIEELKKEAHALKAQVKQLEDENSEARQCLGGEKTEGKAKLGRQIELLTASYEKKLADLQSDFDQQRAKDAEGADQAFALLEEAKEGLEADVSRLQRWVEESRQKTDDLEHEVDAYKKDTTTTLESTEDVTDAHNPRGSPVPNELGSFSPSRSRAGRTRRYVVSRWGNQSPVMFYSDSEDTDNDDEQPMARRRRHSSEEDVSSMKDASTQTDGLRSRSEASTSTLPRNLPRNLPSNLPSTSESAIQSTPNTKPTTTEMGTQTMPESKPAMVDQATQTKPVKRPIPLCWRLLYFLLCVLAFILCAYMLCWDESNSRERDMWLKANDYTRRAVISVRAGGGTGTRVPAWLWKEPLMEMSNRHY